MKEYINYLVIKTRKAKKVQQLALWVQVKRNEPEKDQISMRTCKNRVLNNLFSIFGIARKFRDLKPKIFRLQLIKKYLLYFINCLISWFDSKRCCVVSSIPSFPRIRSNRTLVLLVLILAVNVLKKFGFIFMNIFYKKNLIIKKNNLVLNSLTVNLDLITKFLSNRIASRSNLRKIRFKKGFRGLLFWLVCCSNEGGNR